MAYTNSYKPSEPAVSIPTSDGPCDINFAFPLPEQSLQTARIKLVPFIPSVHAEPFITVSAKTEIFRYTPFVFPALPAFHDFVEQWFRSEPTAVLFAIIDKTRLADGRSEAESLVGIAGLIHASSMNLSVEIGPMIILPAYQRTFASTNAIGILLRYCLDLPTTSPSPALGFRRVQWSCHPDNAASIRAAERMGFKMEGHMRWTWILDPGKEGDEVTGEGRGKGRGRGNMILAICWDDWEDGVREHVRNLINRVS